MVDHVQNIHGTLPVNFTSTEAVSKHIFESSDGLEQFEWCKPSMQATKFVVLDEFCCKCVVPILCGKLKAASMSGTGDTSWLPNQQFGLSPLSRSSSHVTDIVHHFLK